MRIRYFLFLFLILPINIFALCNRTITTVGVGDTPAGIAITLDGRFAYVANNNNDSIPGGDTVSVIDLKTNTVIKTISNPFFNEPYTITLNPAGTRAYVTNSSGSTVSVIDVATQQVVQTLTGFDGPSGIAISPNGTIGYVNNYGATPGAGSGNGKTVTVVNLITGAIIDTITVDLAPASLAITPDGRFVYTINYVDGNPGTGTMNVIQTSNNAVVGRITGFSGPFSIIITSNGKFAYVTNFGSNNFFPVGNTVSVVNLTTNTLVKNIKVGIQPSGLAITPDGRFVYVTNYDTLYLGPNFTNLTSFTGTVNVIDTCTNCVLCPLIIVGASPANIAISPNGCRAYVSNYRANNVSVLNIVDHMLINLCK